MTDISRTIDKDSFLLDQRNRVTTLEALTTATEIGVEGVKSPNQSILRHPLFKLLLGALFVAAFSIIGMGFALYVSNNANGKLRSESSCNRDFAAAVDEKIADAVSSLVEGNATQLEGLGAFGEGNLEEMNSKLATVDAVVAQMREDAKALTTAALARTAAIDTVCKSS